MPLSSTLISATSQAGANQVYLSEADAPQLGNAITCMIVCNTSVTTEATVSIYAVPNIGGSVDSVGTNHMIVNRVILPPGETISFDQEKLVLSNNDQIFAWASVTNIVVFTISTLPV